MKKKAFVRDFLFDLVDRFLSPKPCSAKSYETARKEPLEGQLKDGYVRRN
jgi:hypothetical protein